MPEILAKEYGPFTGLQWVIILAGGIGLGLVMRRFIAGKGDAAGQVPSGEYTDEFGFTGGGTQYNQGAIVQDVLEALKAGNPADVTTDPTINPGPNFPQMIVGLKAEKARLVEARKTKQKALAAAKKAGNKAKIADLKTDIDQLSDRILELTAEIKNLYAQMGYKPPTLVID